jgi:cbb3-type cytochrome oxidase subunit 3
MNPYWSNLYDHFKDRRYAALFLIALGGLVLSPILLPAMGLYFLGRGWSAFRLARENRRNQLRYSPLSRDELLAARSKLRNGMKPINRPAPRVPDTFLKY